ncbi:hypothetical protein ACJMK2_003495, partial [Sinanodonta woodiana]
MTLAMIQRNWWQNNVLKLLKKQLEKRKDNPRCLHILSGRGKCTNQSLNKNGQWLRASAALFRSSALRRSPLNGSLFSDKNLIDFEDKLFDYLADKDGLVHISRFKKALFDLGLREKDPRLKECMDKLERAQSSCREETPAFIGGQIDRQTFKEAVCENIVLIAKAFQNHLIIPEFQDFCKDIDTLYWNSRNNISGKV